MINPHRYLDTLKQKKISFFAGVPDSLLRNFCEYVSDTCSKESHIIAANEGAAIGLAIGNHLVTGSTPLVYMQNSGLGNAINPLLSLASVDVYAIPMVLLIGWRGKPDVKDEPQHKHQGRVTHQTLGALGIPTLILSKDEEQAIFQTAEAIDLATKNSAPVAILVQKDTFQKHGSTNALTANNNAIGFSRESAIQTTLASLNPETMIVATTGMISRELYEYRTNHKQKTNTDFLTVGGMGHANQIALAMAISKPELQICCFDGDGAILMHMGSLALIGQSQCKNFTHIVFNNGVHDSVGGQPTIAQKIDLCMIAKACGYDSQHQACSPDELVSILQAQQKTKGTKFIEVLVDAGHRIDLGRPKSTPLENKHELLKWLRN